MLSWLASWFWPSTPTDTPTVTVQCVRVPADGSAPHMVQLRTVAIRAEGNVDSFLFHIPDVRSYWSTANGWRYRDHRRLGVTNQPNVDVDGEYYAFYSFDLDDLPANKRFRGAWGDVFIAKVSSAEFRWEDGSVDYIDVPEVFLRSYAFERFMEQGASP